MSDFQILGKVESVETIAEGNSIRELPRLVRNHGVARWRKRKGVALVRLASGAVKRAEVHW